MNFKIKKKAVSPLIATILLVAVALSLAGILYSWSSQSARETTDTITDTTTKWSECNHVKLYIDMECLYNTTTGVSFVLIDNSTVEISDNLLITITDANYNVATAILTPNFSNRAMVIKSSEFEDPNDPTDFQDLESPVRARVIVSSCPDQFTTATCR